MGETKGRWVLRATYSDWDYYVSLVIAKWDRPRIALARDPEVAEVWSTREAAERWGRALIDEGYVVEVVELS